MSIYQYDILYRFKISSNEKFQVITFKHTKTYIYIEYVYKTMTLRNFFNRQIDSRWNNIIKRTDN